jgi:hypothetical protein
MGCYVAGVGEIRNAHIENLNRRTQVGNTDVYERNTRTLKIKLQKMKLTGFNRIYLTRIILWNVPTCRQKFADVSEERTASFFRFEKKAWSKQQRGQNTRN